MTHDRIHAREPAHHRDRWSVGTVESIETRDGHCHVTVRAEDGGTVDLVVTLAIRDLFVRTRKRRQRPIAEPSGGQQRTAPAPPAAWWPPVTP